MLVGGNDLQVAGQLPDHDRHVETAKMIARMTKQYRRLWQLGYEHDAPNHHSRKRWQELTLVLSGGGTRHEALASQLTEVNPMHPWPQTETTLRVCRHSPGTLGALQSNTDNDYGSLFAVANGLAIDRRHWPIVFQPNQIEPMSHPTKSKTNHRPIGTWVQSRR